MKKKIQRKHLQKNQKIAKINQQFLKNQKNQNHHQNQNPNRNRNQNPKIKTLKKISQKKISN